MYHVGNVEVLTSITLLCEQAMLSEQAMLTEERYSSSRSDRGTRGAQCLIRLLGSKGLINRMSADAARLLYKRSLKDLSYASC